MAKKENQTARTAGVQIFELTMDNPEDQDELNRQLCKPGEFSNDPSGTNACKVNESTTAPTEKKSRA